MNHLHNLIDKLDALEAVALTTRALEVINRLTQNATVETALEIIKLVRNVYTAIADTARERITAEDAHKALDHLEAVLSQNDAAADAAIDAKFDGSDDPA